MISQSPNSTATMSDTTEQNATWHLACSVEDVPDDGGSCVLIEGKQIAIFHFKRIGQWYATDNLCPHRQQMALSRGMIGTTGEEQTPKVACPFHKKSFSLENGECLSGDDFCIHTYEVKVEDSMVHVLVPA